MKDHRDRSRAYGQRPYDFDQRNGRLPQGPPHPHAGYSNFPSRNTRDYGEEGVDPSRRSTQIVPHHRSRNDNPGMARRRPYEIDEGGRSDIEDGFEDLGMDRRKSSAPDEPHGRQSGWPYYENDLNNFEEKAGRASSQDRSKQRRVIEPWRTTTDIVSYASDLDSFEEKAGRASSRDRPKQRRGIEPARTDKTFTDMLPYAAGGGPGSRPANVSPESRLGELKAELDAAEKEHKKAIDARYWMTGKESRDHNVKIVSIKNKIVDAKLKIFLIDPESELIDDDDLRRIPGVNYRGKVWTDRVHPPWMPASLLQMAKVCCHDTFSVTSANLSLSASTRLKYASKVLCAMDDEELLRQR